MTNEERLLTDQAQAPQEDPINAVEVILKLPVSIVNLILFAVAKLPYEQAAGTIAAIRQQGDPQVNAARAALSVSPAPAMGLPAIANRKIRRGAKKG